MIGLVDVVFMLATVIFFMGWHILGLTERVTKLEEKQEIDNE